MLEHHPGIGCSVDLRVWLIPLSWWNAGPAASVAKGERATTRPRLPVISNKFAPAFIKNSHIVLWLVK